MGKTIWYISKYVAPPYAAKVSSRGFSILSELVKKGCCCTLFTSDSNHLIAAPKLERSILKENIDDVDVFWLKTWKYQGARSLGRMISWLDFEWQLFKMPKKNLAKPDVIIVSSLSLLTILNGLWLRRKYKCRLVFEVRDIWPMVLIESGGISNKNPLIKFLTWLEKLGYEKADCVVGTMPNLAQHVEMVIKKPKQVSCVPQGLDTGLLEDPIALSADYVEKYIPKNKFIVCHAGSIGADNALETFFACARIMQEREDIHFLMVGDGYLKNKYQQENADLKNLSFAPRVEKKQVQSVLQQVDVVYFAVNSSPLWAYGQSLNKVIDYMLSGKPIIASYTGFPSMVNEANCGVYIPAEDTIALKNELERFSSMPKGELYDMGSRGRQWILENRQFDKLAEKYLDIINEL